MNNMVDKKKKQPESPIVKFMPLIGIALILAYAAMAYLLLFMPKVGKFMTGGEYDVKPLEARIEDDENYMARLENALADYRAINDAHKNKLNLMLPPSEDVPGLFVQLDEVARANGMVLSSVDTIVDPAGIGGKGVTPVNVAANFSGGTYDEFLKILNDLESLIRVTDVQSIAFSAGSGNYSLMLTTYFITNDLGVKRGTNEPPPQPAF